MHILLDLTEIVELGLLDKLQEYLEKNGSTCSKKEEIKETIQKVKEPVITKEMVISKRIELEEIFDEQDAKDITKEICDELGIKNLIDIEPKDYEKALNKMQNEIDG